MIQILKYGKGKKLTVEEGKKLVACLYFTQDDKLHPDSWLKEKRIHKGLYVNLAGFLRDEGIKNYMILANKFVKEFFMEER